MTRSGAKFTPTPLEQRVPPRASATIVVLRAAAQSMELLLMRRRKSTSFFSDAAVFPGGLVEPGDADRRVLGRVVGMTAAEANERLAIGADGLSYWVAAVRECFEESGILLATDEQHRPVTAVQQSRLAALRAALNSGRLSFAEFLEQERLLIPAQRIAYLERWVSPPIQARRFDTRFFVAEAPQGQQVRHDAAELVDSQWLAPAQILARSDQERLKLLRPTRAIVTRIGRYPTPAAALAQAQATVHAPVNWPCFAQSREGPRLFYVEDPPYAEIHWVDPDESGASTCELQPDVAKRLDRYVTRVLAPNSNAMTGPGTNSYLVGNRDLAVIDPGPDDAAHIGTLIAAGAGRIRWILLTHTHSDHAPAAVALSKATGAPIAARLPPEDAPDNARISVDRVLEDGELLRLDGCTLRVIHTPGHASNHLCYLLEETRMLFSGDHLVQGFTVVIAPPDGSMSDYLRSLARLALQDIAILAPGHGYLIGNPQGEIARIISHRLAREDQVRRALADTGAPATVQDLLPAVYADVPAALHPLAALSLQAHLEKLQADGEAIVSGGQWRRPPLRQ